MAWVTELPLLRDARQFRLNSKDLAIVFHQKKGGLTLIDDRVANFIASAYCAGLR
jgi:hypothetical protein